MTDASIALLRASGLPDRWQRRERFVILDAGSAGTASFVATWQAWRDDPQRCASLHFITLGNRPPRATHAASMHALERQLLDAWPPLTRNLHRRAFENGRVQLLLAAGDAADWLREIVAIVDAFLFSELADDVDLLTREPHLAKACARLAAPRASLAARRLDAVAEQALQAAGFRVGTRAGQSDDVRSACYAPSFTPRGAAARRRPVANDPHAVIVGAGLAGCAAAWALAEQGWRSTVLERHPSIATEASGNSAGIFHGIVNGQDATHARFNRAAALEAHVAASIAIERHAVPGSTEGLLQLADAQASVAAMHVLLQRLALPAAYVQALDAATASALAGLQLQRPAWFYPAGGWINPGGLARSFLERAAPRSELRVGVDVRGLRRVGAAWQLLDVDGDILETAETVVLANAGGALKLLGGRWPVEAMRGQISILSAADKPVLRLPRVPICGAGYLLPEIGGSAIFGATSVAGDDDLAVRVADHAYNLAQLARLAPTGGVASITDLTHLQGRTAWRWVSRDRLPLIGPVPLGRGDAPVTIFGSAMQRLDQPRFVPRERGLYLYTALGSRGITWAALGAQVLASSITGAPAPLEASLLDALDPARFLVRERRRSGSG